MLAKIFMIFMVLLLGAVIYQQIVMMLRSRKTINDEETKGILKIQTKRIGSDVTSKGYVVYTINGREYRQEVDFYIFTMKNEEPITVYYNRYDPSDIRLPLKKHRLVSTGLYSAFLVFMLVALYLIQEGVLKQR